jgi:hypothetical protein
MGGLKVLQPAGTAFDDGAGGARRVCRELCWSCVGAEAVAGAGAGGSSCRVAGQTAGQPSAGLCGVAGRCDADERRPGSGGGGQRVREGDCWDRGRAASVWQRCWMVVGGKVEVAIAVM